MKKLVKKSLQFRFLTCLDTSNFYQNRPQLDQIYIIKSEENVTHKDEASNRHRSVSFIIVSYPR